MKTAETEAELRIVVADFVVDQQADPMADLVLPAVDPSLVVAQTSAVVQTFAVVQTSAVAQTFAVAQRLAAGLNMFPIDPTVGQSPPPVDRTTVGDLSTLVADPMVDRSLHDVDPMVAPGLQTVARTFADLRSLVPLQFDPIVAAPASPDAVQTFAVGTLVATIFARPRVRPGLEAGTNFVALTNPAAPGRKSLDRLLAVDCSAIHLCNHRIPGSSKWGCRPCNRRCDRTAGSPDFRDIY